MILIITKNRSYYKNIYLSPFKFVRTRDSKRRKSSYQNGYDFTTYTHEQIICIRLDFPYFLLFMMSLLI